MKIASTVSLNPSLCFRIVPFAHMGLHQDPDALRHAPLIEKLVIDLIDNTNDNIVFFEGLEATGKCLSLGSIDSSQSLKVFVDFIDRIFSIRQNWG
jgi:hypothetical protein